MKIPVTLKHKPVFVVEDYEKTDGRYDRDKTDAKGLTLGLAQWNERGKLEVSAKVWRYTGEKWSRQSEELPIHRVIDLAMMICEAKKYLNQEAYKLPKLYDEKNPLISKLAVQGMPMIISVCIDNPMIDEDIKLFRDSFSKDDELLGERLARLSAILKELGY